MSETETPTAPDADAAPGGPSKGERARANQRALDGCARHFFEPIRAPGDGAVRSRWRCARCAGEVDGKAAGWYAAGVRHGRQIAERRQCREAAEAAAAEAPAA